MFQKGKKESSQRGIKHYDCWVWKSWYDFGRPSQ